MKKIITLLLLLIVISIGSYAQQHDETTLKNGAKMIIRTSPFIFEGTVISTKSYISKNKDFCVSNIVQISKIFRGHELSKGTIEVITHGGTATYEAPNTGLIMSFWPPLHGRENHLTVGQTGIFFCIPADTNVTVLLPSTDNSIRAQTNFQLRDATVIYLPATDGAVKWVDVSFKSKEDVYNFIAEENNIIIPKEDAPIEKKA